MRGFGAVGLALLLVFAAEAHVDAYLDPGSGSMLIQLLLGGVAGAAVILKLGWQRLLGTFRSPRAAASAEATAGLAEAERRAGGEGAPQATGEERSGGPRS